ncbi:MAG: hypothetical protein IJV22_06770 [Bacteroidales bacterium]|nr:hypothetical protein [Bacteroidales bacterium]
MLHHTIAVQHPTPQRTAQHPQAVRHSHSTRTASTRRLAAVITRCGHHIARAPTLQHSTPSIYQPNIDTHIHPTSKD